MSSKRKVYCVFGCVELGAYMHRFPHPKKREELFKTWLSIVDEKLKEKDSLKIYKSKRICDYHFKPEHKMAYSHRLRNIAIPSLHLTGITKSPGISVLLEHNYSQPRMWTDENKENIEYFPQNILLHSSASNEGHQTPKTLKIIDHERPSSSQLSKAGPSNAAAPSFIINRYKQVQKENKTLRMKMKYMQIRTKNYKARLETLKNTIQHNAFNNVTKNMSIAGKMFTAMQYKGALKAPKGRRFTLEEKIMALTFFKRSPRLYYYLYKIFKLPSSKSLKILLSKVKLSPGINETIFSKLKDTVKGMNVDERLVTLIFDEMSLTPNVQYDSTNDKFIGFVTNDNSTKIANHALVFMIKGIKLNFKQPVAYYFTQNLSKNEMKDIIINVIRNVQSTGLKILCSVCDQGATNVSAIDSLIENTKADYLRRGKQWQEDFYEVNRQKIIPLYDVPHLFKGLRNNLLTKDLRYIDDEDGKKPKIIKWDYFQQLYEADKSFGELRYLHKLTEEHINPQKIRKMRVKMATQLFSHSVAVAVEHLTARKKLSEECRNLIPVVLLLDKLFDSLNAGTFNIQNGKIFRSAVKRNSPHHKLWQDSIKFLKNVRFITKKTEGDKIRLIETTAPSLRNLIKTIQGVQALWTILYKRYSFDCLLTRNLNQDPIENFFGNIRSLGVRNVAPNCRAFEGAFKTLLLNNFSSPQAINANCEEDLNQCLQTLHFLIKENDNIINNKAAEVNNLEVSSEMFSRLSNLNFALGDPNDHQQQRYVCGWALSQCLSKVTKNCEICKSSLISKNLEGNEYIRAKEYNKKKRWLCYPSNQLVCSFNEIQEITVTFLRTNFEKNQPKEKNKMLIDAFVTFPIMCNVHEADFKQVFTDTSINILFYSWSRSMNRILSGKIKYTENDDPLKKYAQNYFDKNKRHKIKL